MKKSIFILFFILKWFSVFSQFNSKPIFDISEDFSPTDINPNMSIFGLNQKEQIKLFEKLNFVDKKYRLLLENCKKSTPNEECGRYWKLMSKNDKALQNVFDKLLVKYKWPSQKLIELYKIWFMIWHATDHGLKRTDFYKPYIVDAYLNGNISKEFYNIIINKMK